jgi:hypothetical protein
MGISSTEHAAHSLGSADSKEQSMRGPSIQRYEAMVAVRHQAQAYLPTRVRPAAKTYDAATVAMQPVVRAVIPAPYARSHSGTSAQLAWRLSLARRWVLAHVGMSLVALVFSVPLLMTPTAHLLGNLIFAYALSGLGLGALAWRQMVAGRTASSAWLLLLNELLALGLALVAIGPHFEIFALLPGALLLAALLADYGIALVGGALAFMLYATMIVLGQVGHAQPVALLPTGTQVWLDLVLVGCGMALLGLVVALAARRLGAAQFAEAAALYRVEALERRAQTKRIAIDADAIAMQTQITRAMRSGSAQPVTTCEDLAPLARMVNTVTKRIPGLLRDREERIRLERAVQSLTTALETAWAGFTFTWPEPSGTSVDRLVAMLRPQRATEQEAAS